MPAAVFVAVSVAVTAVVVAWFLVTTRRLKDVLESHPDAPPDTPAERFYGPHPFAPAGPDAEAQRPEDTGNAWDPPPPPPRRSRPGDGRTPGGPDGQPADHPSTNLSDLAHGSDTEDARPMRGLIAEHTSPGAAPPARPVNDVAMPIGDGSPVPTPGCREPTAPGVAISTQTIGHRVVVHACGELDVVTDPLLRRRLAELVDTGAEDVVIDLSEVTFLGVEAVRVLLEARQWLVDRGGRLRLTSPSPMARRLIELTGAAEVLGTDTRR